MKSPAASKPMPPHIEALERALGGVVARARGEVELLKSQADAVVAAANARVAEAEVKLNNTIQQIAERLAGLKDGVDGRDGIDGVDGVDGTPGTDGLAGADGKDGADGAPGRDGKDGVDGNDGVDGKDGRDLERVAVEQEGRDVTFVFETQDTEFRATVELPEGPAGADGKDGRDGEQGPAGPTGKLAMVKPWTDKVHYDGEVRSHRGSTWQARCDTAREPPHDDWTLIAGKGDDGKGFNPRGLWIGTEEYERNDVVALNGGSFVAVKDNPGPCPGEGWKLMAQQGKRGERGEKGERGERGPAGPVAVAMSIDGEGLLTLRNADGSVVQCDLYPVLSKIERR